MLRLRHVFLHRHHICLKHRRIARIDINFIVAGYSTKTNRKDAECKNKSSQCLTELPPLGPKCSRTPPDICQGPVKVPPLPIECKSDPAPPPIYDKNCLRPYNNPCLPDISKTCKCNMVPRPCLAPCEKKRKICLGEPDCAYERKADWGYRLMQALLGIGLIVGGLILYRIYGKEKKSDQKLSLITKQRDKRFQRPMEIIKVPSSSSDFPDKVDYLLIGGGTASFAAQKAIRSAVSDAKILIVSNGPPFKPAMRPPLSSWLWKDPDREKALNLEFFGPDGKNKKLFFEPDQYYTPLQNLNTPKGGVSVAQGWSIKKLNVDNRVAILDNGKKIKFEKCLLATGGRPKIPPPFHEADPDVLKKVTFYRNSFDFQELEELIQDGMKCIAVVGGGLLGTEMAAALRERTMNENIKIVNIVKDEGNLQKILPSYLAAKVTEVLAKRGIHIMTKTLVEDTVRDGNFVKLYVTNEKCVVANHVVVATGIDPNVDLAADSCLEIDEINGGFMVNSEMQSRDGVYAAGDCASFYDCSLGRRRAEHHNFAMATGQIAGENMSGKKNGRLVLQPHFGCNLFPDYVIEGAGIVDASKPTVGVYPRVHPVQEIGKDHQEGIAQVSRKGKQGISDKGPAMISSHENGSSNENGLHDDDDDGELTRIENGDEETMKQQTFNEGVVFYLNDKEEIIGVLLLNLPGRLLKAQSIIQRRSKYDEIDNLVKELDLHSKDNNKRGKHAKRNGTKTVNV